MTREEIIAMALKHTVGGLEFDDGGLLAFFNEAYAAGASAEREECAKVCEASPSYDWHKFACEAAAAIRARGNHV